MGAQYRANTNTEKSPVGVPAGEAELLMGCTSIQGYPAEQTAGPAQDLATAAQCALSPKYDLQSEYDG